VLVYELYNRLLSKGYPIWTFNEEAAKKISSCILEKEREVNANQE